MKKQIIISTLLVAALIPWLTSCHSEKSEDVNQDKIHQRLVLEYDKNTDITAARAQFRFGDATGTLLELTSPSNITANGNLMTWDAGLAFYQKTFTGVATPMTYVYTNTNDQAYTNTLSMQHTIGFKTDLDTISKSGSFELFWEGDSVLADEIIWIGIWKNNNVLDQALVSTSADNAKSIIIPMSTLALVNTGVTHISISREYYPAIVQATGNGGDCVVRYKGLNKQIVIVN
ncbi:MAG: hypothetical protein V2A54_11595 [Bacteroidota bacterium]